jgi:anti-sigma regulatory factor (Ser/Thr protein kinase)
VAEHRRTFGVLDNVGRSGADRFLAALLTSELATNAVVHAASPFEISVQAEPGHLRVEVINDEPELILQMNEPDPADPDGGRGLRIVEAFAHRWGAESSRDEKVVWFELGRP